MNKIKYIGIKCIYISYKLNQFKIISWKFKLNMD